MSTPANFADWIAEEQTKESLEYLDAFHELQGCTLDDIFDTEDAIERLEISRKRLQTLGAVVRLIYEHSQLRAAEEAAQ